MDRPLVALVLAGGIGTRLYPASRPDRPKQFLSMGGDRSLLSRTVDRVAFADRTVVSTRPELVEGVRERAPDVDVVVEPAAKDTGPALVYATHRLREQVGDCVVLAVPSDHYVTGDFEGSARRAATVAAETGALVTVGVEPTRPETGYGYIEPGPDRGRYREVAAFHEKPDADTAASYTESGYLWNAGMFAWTPEALLRAADSSPLAPLVEALERGEAAAGFEAVPETSVDYAIMERAENVAVVPASFEWDDLGSWDALARVLEADDDGNVALGSSLTVDAANTVAASEDAHVTLVGVEDLVVVAWDDRVLVVPREQAGRVREVVERLREADRLE